MPSRLHKSQAITLVEMLLALLVLGILLFVAARFYVNVRENAKVSDAAARVNTIIHASYEWLTGTSQANFCGAGSSGGCSGSEQISVKKLLDLKLINPSIAENPFGSNAPQVSVMPATANYDYITITYQDVSPAACAKLVDKLKSKARVINNVPQISCQTVNSVQVFQGTF